jgi:hypothetical protein
VQKELEALRFEEERQVAELEAALQLKQQQETVDARRKLVEDVTQVGKARMMMMMMMMMRRRRRRRRKGMMMMVPRLGKSQFRHMRLTKQHVSLAQVVKDASANQTLQERVDDEVSKFICSCMQHQVKYRISSSSYRHHRHDPWCVTAGAAAETAASGAEPGAGGVARVEQEQAALGTPAAAGRPEEQAPG